jgi:cell division protein FtsI (penicillin-binding protein 3)
VSVAQPPFEPLDETFGPAPGGVRGRLWGLWSAFVRRLEGTLASASAAEGRDDTRLRIFFVMALFAAAFVCAALSATKAALFPSVGVRAAVGPPPAAARADLTDRNGRVLAADIVRWGLYVRPQEVSDRAVTLAALTRAIPSLSPSRLANVLAHPGGEFYVAGDLTPDTRAALHDLALPGLYFQEETARAYPLEAVGAHVIGIASRDGSGLSGAEKAFDVGVRAGTAPVALSIDLRVQAALQSEVTRAAEHFGVRDAAGIVVNVRTGEILAMTSWPEFDADAPDPRHPEQMMNHAAATVYEPGSVFKVFTLAMGLDTGLVTPATVFDVHTPLVLPGQTIHDYDKGDTVLPLWEVFTHSSNIGAARMALRVGADNMDRYFHAFGLFDKAPSELVESARPLTPRRLSDNIVASMAFGHAISVSPLAIATGMSAILNGGVWRPLTLRRLEPGAALAPGRRVIKESTSRTMLWLMRLNATDPHGTGKSAEKAAPGYRLGGKTGTATKLVDGRYNGAKKNLASFAAIFPTDGGFDQDRYLVLVMMDEPHAMPETGGFTTGGAVSAPIAGRIVERIAPFLGVRRVLPAVPAGAAPAPTDVEGRD